MNLSFYVFMNNKVLTIKNKQKCIFFFFYEILFVGLIKELLNIKQAIFMLKAFSNSANHIDVVVLSLCSFYSYFLSDDHIHLNRTRGTLFAAICISASKRTKPSSGILDAAFLICTSLTLDPCRN